MRSYLRASAVTCGLCGALYVLLPLCSFAFGQSATSGGTDCNSCTCDSRSAGASCKRTGGSENCADTSCAKCEHNNDPYCPWPS